MRWVAVLSLILSLALPALADSGSESAFHSKINQSRSANGLPALSMDAGLQAQARTHTDAMIEAGKVYHSSLSLGEWVAIAENVARGGSVSSIHQALMDSSAQRANILGDYNHVGIGTGTLDGELYVTTIFAKGVATTTTTTVPTTTTTTQVVATTQPPQTTTTVPATTTTTTTAPRNTTTTTTVANVADSSQAETETYDTDMRWLCSMTLPVTVSK